MEGGGDCTGKERKVMPLTSASDSKGRWKQEDGHQRVCFLHENSQSKGWFPISN